MAETRIYTVRLAATQPAAATATVIYQAPAEGTIVLRDLVISNAGYEATAASLYLVVDGVFVWCWGRASLPPGHSEHVDLRQVIEPGEELHAYSDKGSTMFLLTGYHFS